MENKASAYSFEKIAAIDSPLLKAMMKCADEMEVIDSLTDKEFQFAQALYELTIEFRERVKEDCKQQDLSSFETEKRMATLDHTSFSALQPLLKAFKAMRKPETKSVQSQTEAKPKPIMMSVSCQSAIGGECQVSVSSKATEESAKLEEKPKPPKCYLCEERHFLYRCGAFKQKVPRARLDFIRTHLCATIASTTDT